MNVLFGGTFDPIHLGHLHLAEEVLGHFSVDKFWFVPAGRNPHKDSSQASPQARLDMVKIAVRDLKDSRVEVLDWEVTQPGPSFTIDTVDKLLATGVTNVSLVMGNEVYQNLPKWKEPERLLDSVGVIIVTRDPDLHVPLLQDSHQVLVIRPLPYAATDVRKALKLGEMPQGIQRKVWQYIKENRLYAVKE